MHRCGVQWFKVYQMQVLWKRKNLHWHTWLCLLHCVWKVEFLFTLRQSGASREEVISTILVELPAAGHSVTQVVDSKTNIPFPWRTHYVTGSLFHGCDCNYTSVGA